MFCASGAAVAVMGALPWVAALAGGPHDIGWPLRTLAAVAFLAGLFVLLIGIGLLRARAGVRRSAGEARLDAELVAAAAAAAATAAHEPCAQDPACATCDASCALNALR